MSGTPLAKVAAPARRALASIGATTLEELATHRRDEIAALHGMGPKALQVLERALEERGMGFAG